MINIPAIAQLQSDWFRFSDLDRASAVLRLKQSGISIRGVAAQLQFSESLLRHLLQALKALASDRDLAQMGKISTNELVRRAKAISLSPSPQPREMDPLERVRQTRIAADLICQWLLETQLFGPAREAIVKEVQRSFRLMKEAGLHPPVAARPDTHASEIIKQTKPPVPADNRTDIVAWFAQWLCRWSFFVFRDDAVRDAALDLALKEQLGT